MKILNPPFDEDLKSPLLRIGLFLPNIHARRVKQEINI